jgi:hypothetical protein
MKGRAETLRKYNVVENYHYSRGGGVNNVRLEPSNFPNDSRTQS